MSDAERLAKALDDYVNHRCANCGHKAPASNYLCNACWTAATNQSLRRLMVECTPQLRAN